MRSFCAFTRLEFASCLVTVNSMTRSIATALYHFRKSVVENATCHVVSSSRVPSSSNIAFSGGCLLSLVLFTRASFPAQLFLSLTFSLSQYPLTTLSSYPLQLFAHPSSLLANCLSILSAFSVPFAHIVSTLLLISVTIQILSVNITASSSPFTKSCSQASQCPLQRLLLHHLLYSTWSISSIAVSGRSQCCLHTMLMGRDYCRLPRNSHTKSESFLSTMQKNMSRKFVGMIHFLPASLHITNVHEISSSLLLSYLATCHLHH